MNNDLKIILGDYVSLVQSDKTEIKDNEAICFITLKRSIIYYPCCGRRMNIKDYRKCKISHNMIRGKNTTIILRKRRLLCPQCNNTETEKNPFTENKGGRLSQFS